MITPPDTNSYLSSSTSKDPGGATSKLGKPIAKEKTSPVPITLRRDRPARKRILSSGHLDSGYFSPFICTFCFNPYSATQECSKDINHTNAIIPYIEDTLEFCRCSSRLNNDQTCSNNSLLINIRNNCSSKSGSKSCRKLNNRFNFDHLSPVDFQEESSEEDEISDISPSPTVISTRFLSLDKRLTSYPLHNQPNNLNIIDLTSSNRHHNSSRTFQETLIGASNNYTQTNNAITSSDSPLSILSSDSETSTISSPINMDKTDSIILPHDGSLPKNKIVSQIRLSRPDKSSLYLRRQKSKSPDALIPSLTSIKNVRISIKNDSRVFAEPRIFETRTKIARIRDKALVCQRIGIQLRHVGDSFDQSHLAASRPFWRTLDLMKLCGKIVYSSLTNY
ncbi:unnamed protein product [Gordionus sp. m RMFG-2023]|uniref:uncharacterized protein LOC135924429 n=1 Tax=Gordionus sp. m RMFG-2023 TaxID=3053472 RepID=UPI0030E0A628